MLSRTSSANHTLRKARKTSGFTWLWALALAVCTAHTAPAFCQIIQIGSITELQLIGNNPAYPLDGGYILTQDIDASATAAWNSGAGFDPIGTYDEAHPELAFTGTFDGQGMSLPGLRSTVLARITAAFSVRLARVEPCRTWGLKAVW